MDGNAMVNNNRIYNNSLYGRTGSMGMSGEPSLVEVSFVNNEVFGNGAGAGILGVAEFTVAANEFYENYTYLDSGTGELVPLGYGILVGGGNFYGGAPQGVIRDNRIFNVGPDSCFGIAVEGTDGTVVVENNILFNEGSFLHPPLEDGEISIDPVAGVMPKGTHGILVLDNPLFLYPSHVIARNNLIYNFNVGFNILSKCLGGSAVLENNTIAGNVDVGLYREPYAFPGTGECDTPDPLLIRNGIFYANGTPAPGNAYDHDILDGFAPVSPIVVEYSNIEEAVYPGAGNISLPPLFVDPGLGNYTLQSTANGYPADSPCIDAGNHAAEYNDPDDSRNDMGYTGGPLGLNTPGAGDFAVEVEELSLELQDLSQGGRTSVEKLELVEPYNLPNITLDFMMDMGGISPFYFEISSTAEFETAEVCIDLGFDLSGIEDFLKLYTLDENGDLQEIPGSGVEDTRICGTVSHFTPIIAAIPDTDEDGFYDHQDNCPWAFNADQVDSDGDGVGDVCESTGWGVASTAGVGSSGNEMWNYLLIVLLPVLFILRGKRKV